MQPLSGSEERTLGTRSFVADYELYRVEFLDLALRSYREASDIVGKPISLDAFVDVYTAALTNSSTFIACVERKQVIPADSELFYAGLMSRYILARDWAYIESPWLDR